MPAIARSLIRLGLLSLVLSPAAAAAALAAQPVSYGVYNGGVSGAHNVFVTFSSSLDGKRLMDGEVDRLGQYCPGHSAGASVTLGGAAVSRSGAFTLHGTARVRPKGSKRSHVAATFTLRGRFTSARRAGGTVSARYTGASSCDRAHAFSVRLSSQIVN